MSARFQTRDLEVMIFTLIHLILKIDLDIRNESSRPVIVNSIRPMRAPSLDEYFLYLLAREIIISAIVICRAWGGGKRELGGI